MTKTTYKERDEDKPEPLGSWAEAFAADLKRAAERIARNGDNTKQHDNDQGRYDDEGSD